MALRPAVAPAPAAEGMVATDLADAAPAAPVRSHRLGWREARWPLALALLVLASGLVFSLGWEPVVAHRSQWVTPGDIWSTFRSAQFVGWGDVAGITRAVTLPGIAVVLAPVALVATALHLSASYPLVLAHPSAWLLLGPVEMALGAAALVPVDMLARRLGVGGRRRIALGAAEAVVLWPVVVLWGHPEDALAVGSVAVAVLAAASGRWRGSGWWFGLAVVLQPFVLAVLPVVVAMAPSARQRVAYVVRSAVPSLLLLAVPLATEFRAVVRTLAEQANYPGLNHPTPWLSLAPVLVPAHWVTKPVAYRTPSGFGVAHEHVLAGAVVGTGPGHLLALVLACGVGLWAWRARPHLQGLVWLCAVCLGLRCAFEAVMDPFYVWPCLALVLVGAAARGGWRLPAAIAVSCGASVFAEYHLGPWPWYGTLMVLLGAGLACAWPAGGLRGAPVDEQAAGPAWARPG